jgi:hypothetical protein
MSGTCCRKPIARIITVGTFEAGITGLDQAIQEVIDSGVENEQELDQLLLEKVVRFGNYISPGTEDEYRKALLREFRIFKKKSTSQTIEPRESHG